MKKRIISITVIITILLTVLAACGQAQRTLTVEELLDLGEKYLLELNYEQALMQFQRVIELEPMNPRGYLGAAEAYVGLGRPTRAITILEDGLRAIPGNARLQEMLDELTEPEGSAGANAGVSGNQTGQGLQPSLGSTTDQEYEPDGSLGVFTVHGTLTIGPGNDPRYMTYLAQYDGRVGMHWGVLFQNPIRLDTGDSVSVAIVHFLSHDELSELFGEAPWFTHSDGVVYPNPNVFDNTLLMTGRLFKREDSSELTPAVGIEHFEYLFNPFGAEYDFTILSVER